MLWKMKEDITNPNYIVITITNRLKEFNLLVTRTKAKQLIRLVEIKND